MDLSYYTMTPLESWITKVYKRNGIDYASDLDMDYIASIFGGVISDTMTQSHVRWEDDEYRFFVVFLNEDLGYKQRRLEFFHELCHPLKHIGMQDRLPLHYRQMQEVQASHFQMYAALPFYLFEKFIETPSHIFLQTMSEEFQLPETFIKQRMSQINRRIYTGKSAAEFKANFRTELACHPYWL